jgi:hypothetical protein
LKKRWNLSVKNGQPGPRARTKENKMKKYIKTIVYTIFFMLVVSGNCFSASLFKEYTEKSRQELMDETQAMSKEIKDKFNQKSMENAQQKIDYYDYFSNLKKMVLYGGKLATYDEYEPRDREFNCILRIAKNTAFILKKKKNWQKHGPCLNPESKNRSCSGTKKAWTLKIPS